MKEFSQSNTHLEFRVKIFISIIQFSVKYGCAIACSALIRIFGTQTSSFCSKSRPFEFNRGTTWLHDVVGWYTGK